MPDCHMFSNVAAVLVIESSATVQMISKSTQDTISTEVQTGFFTQCNSDYLGMKSFGACSWTIQD